MTPLQTRIEELVFDGYDAFEIADKLSLSVDEVEAQIALLEEADFEDDFPMSLEYDDEPFDGEYL